MLEMAGGSTRDERTALERLRRRAIKLLRQGMTAEAVADRGAKEAPAVFTFAHDPQPTPAARLGRRLACQEGSRLGS